MIGEKVFKIICGSIGIISLAGMVSCSEAPNSLVYGKSENVFQEIKVVLDQSVELKTSGIFDQMEFIALQENGPESYIAEVTKVVVSDKVIAILEILGLQRSIFLFDRQGQFLHKIISPKEGPGSFFSAFDFFIDDDNKEIYILDPLLKKIIRYDFKGNLQGADVIQTDHIFEKFVRLPNGKYAFYTGDNQTGEASHGLYYLEENLSSIKGSYVTKPLYLSGWVTDEPAFSSFSFRESRFLFKQFFNDTLYGVYKDRVVPVYRIDFGEDWVSKDFISYFKNTPGSKVQKLNKDQSVKGISVVEETASYLFFSGIARQQKYSFLYKKRDGQVLVFKQLQNDLNKANIGNKVVSKFKNNLVLLSSPTQLCRNISTSKTTSAKTIKKNDVENLCTSLLQRKNENPIIVLAKLKDDPL